MSNNMCNNTLLALEQIIDSMDNGGQEFLQDLSKEERYAFERLWAVCQNFMCTAVVLLEDEEELAQ